MTSLGSVIKTALLAGLVAGAVVAGFHWLVTEPVIERAIEIEERLSRAQGSPVEEPVVSRATQKVGLIVGFFLLGPSLGLLFGVLFHFTGAWLPATWPRAVRGFLLALLTGWSVAVFPFLKYPANPPGVGDPETIWYRQALYFGFIGLSVLGAVMALRLHRLLASRARSSSRAPGQAVLTLTLYALYSAAVYAAMPPNPDPVRIPADVVWNFRAISLAGLVLFWAVLGGAFGWLSRERGGQA